MTSVARKITWKWGEVVRTHEEEGRRACAKTNDRCTGVTVMKEAGGSLKTRWKGSCIRVMHMWKVCGSRWRR